MEKASRDFCSRSRIPLFCISSTISGRIIRRWEDWTTKTPSF